MTVPLPREEASELDAALDSRDTTLELFTPPARLGASFLVLRDGHRLTKATQRVFVAMASGGWVTTEELRAIGGSSGDRRARDLRDRRYGNLTIEVKNVNRGLFTYRLVATPASLLYAADILKIPRSAILVGAVDR